jgi:hypothetical protein
MIMSSNNKIFNDWNGLLLPTKGHKMMFQYLNTNLWIFKTYDGRFGFLISGTLGQTKNNYKNIIIEWQYLVEDKENRIKLKNCLIIEASQKINSQLFCSNISSLFKVHDKNYFFKINEIEDSLKEIEEITLKDEIDFSEVIGVWGEIYLLNELINKAKVDKDKMEIIESWEGAENRSKIDFNFKSKKIQIEVKTTIDLIRIHHFNGLEQVTKINQFEGFLASLCINLDDSGLSCIDLINSIKKNIKDSCLPSLENKIKIRGKASNNNKYRFVINPSKQMEFFDFLQVPKPLIEDGVGEVQWTAVLENKKFLIKSQKEKILNLRS